MARTPITVQAMPVNSAIASPAGTTIDPTNQHVIAAAKPEKLLLRVTNTNGTQRTITLKAGAYPPAWAAGQGDLACVVAATTGVAVLGPFESGRFLQKDGSLLIDCEASMAGVIQAFELARG
ncbi:hypothetical protein [Dactylosporangium sp. CS-033363]|uniref:hypothetical protein n=1 Tax=Dactylosporangium sp. CS-033363 TaxID=3239935 RepID=UPI003D8D3477